MKNSEQLNELAKALAIAQGQIQNPEKDKKNPFLKNKYASLDSFLSACKKPLSENGLSIVQFPGIKDGKVFIETILLHASGQWLSEILDYHVIEEKGRSSLQSLGATITYLRRYSLSSVLGMAAEEDTDGETGDKKDTDNKKAQSPTNGNGRNQTHAKPPAVKMPSQEQISELYGLGKQLKFTSKEETFKAISVAVGVEINNIKDITLEIYEKARDSFHKSLSKEAGVANV